MLPLLRCIFAHLLVLQYPDHHQNLISSSLYYSGPVHKISSQSVHNVLSNVAHRQTNKQTNQRYQKHNLLCQGGNNCSKVCEKIIFKHLFNYCRDNDIISIHQSGFTAGNSTAHQLVYLYNTFCKALNDKKDVRIVFCVQSKAFDRVWHQGLLYKLECIGITGDLLSWFQSYLHRRQQRVIIHGVNSQWGIIPAGVSFLIYINDITEKN